VASVISGRTKHFIFQIHWISIIRCLYFNLFSAFCITFLSDGIPTSISKQILSLFLTIMWGLFARTSLSVCTPHDVAMKELDQLLTHSDLTHTEVSSLVPISFWGVVFISLGNLLRGIRFTCNHFLLSCIFSKTGVIFNFFAISVLVLWSV
jgi:hypothetical protein